MQKNLTRSVTISIILTIILFSGCPSTKKISLFNGRDFSGWHIFHEDQDIDVFTVWSVKDGVIRCTGSPFGYIRTEDDYANYKLHVEWRWPDEPTNSGVFVHMSGPDKLWPKSIECQLQSGNAGDFIAFPDTDFKERINKNRYRIQKKAESSEKPPGEWNIYEIICQGNTIQVYVNGVLQNEATETNVNSGKICLQSEGKTIEFRNIYIESL